MSLGSSSKDWLSLFLAEVQLQDFYKAFKYDLQVTELIHFNHVHTADLYSIGLSGPAVARVKEALKHHRRALGLPNPRRKVHAANLLTKLKYGSPRGPYLMAMSEPVSPAHRKHSGSARARSFAERQNVFMSRSEDQERGGREPQDAGALEDTITGGAVVSQQLTCLIAPQDVQLHGRLGSGSFSVVWRGEWRMPTGKLIPVAVKVLRPRGSLPASATTASSDYVSNVLTEALLMQSISHPNLTRIYGIIPADPLMIVTELAPLGSLLKHLRAHSYHLQQHEQHQQQTSLAAGSSPSAAFTVDALWDMGIQLARGMAYLAQHHLVHRDLAARNVLLLLPLSSTFPLVKITDFGLLRRTNAHSNATEEFGENAVPLYAGGNEQGIAYAWSALEAIRGGRFSQASDVWSWAVTVWEIWTGGAVPWSKYSSEEIVGQLEAGHRLPWPRLACPRRLYQLMLACWRSEPGSRPTFAYLAERLSKVGLTEVEAVQVFDEADRMDVEVGDRILVIDGRPENFWWWGQNLRTGEISSFPREIVKLRRKLSPQDISCPISGSFVHVGHFGIDGQQWGHVDHIDPSFLAGVSVRHADTLSQSYAPPQRRARFRPPSTGTGPTDSFWRPLSDCGRSDEEVDTDRRSEFSFSAQRAAGGGAAAAERPPLLNTYDEGEDERRHLDNVAAGSTIATQILPPSPHYTYPRGLNLSALREAFAESVTNGSASVLLPPPPAPSNSKTGRGCGASGAIIAPPPRDKTTSEQTTLTAPSTTAYVPELRAPLIDLYQTSGSSSCSAKNLTEHPSPVSRPVSVPPGEFGGVNVFTSLCPNPYFRAAWNSWMSSAQNIATSASAPSTSPFFTSLGHRQQLPQSQQLPDAFSRRTASVYMENTSHLFGMTSTSDDVRVQRPLTPTAVSSTADDFARLYLNSESVTAARTSEASLLYNRRNPFISTATNGPLTNSCTVAGLDCEPQCEKEVLVGASMNPFLSPITSAPKVSVQTQQGA
uniref:non-specific protein-tyrosine kinase n=1 Tax=Schistocephalus solidus TaxID=70667 RepID=A0A0X3PCU5_SCHSO